MPDLKLLYSLPECTFCGDRIGDPERLPAVPLGFAFPVLARQSLTSRVGLRGFVGTRLEPDSRCRGLPRAGMLA
jgi:hypothetical protein